MERKFEKVTGYVFGAVFAACAVTALLGIVFKQAYWHLFSFVVTTSLSVFFIHNAIKGE